MCIRDRSWCEAKGWAFDVVTDEMLNSIRNQNIRELARYGRYQIAAETQQAITIALSVLDRTIAIGELITLLNAAEPQKQI